nr:unnamed protein product [Digitaria exilis]
MGRSICAQSRRRTQSSPGRRDGRAQRSGANSTDLRLDRSWPQQPVRLGKASTGHSNRSVLARGRRGTGYYPRVEKALARRGSRPAPPRPAQPSPALSSPSAVARAQWTAAAAAADGVESEGF